jgi:hypothetical protein
VSNPYWPDAPPWARFYAEDKDGAGYWYERTPVRRGDVWLSVGGRTALAERGTHYTWAFSLQEKPHALD